MHDDVEENCISEHISSDPVTAPPQDLPKTKAKLKGWHDDIFNFFFVTKDAVSHQAISLDCLEVPLNLFVLLDRTGKNGRSRS